MRDGRLAVHGYNEGTEPVLDCRWLPGRSSSSLVRVTDGGSDHFYTYDIPTDTW